MEDNITNTKGNLGPRIDLRSELIIVNIIKYILLPLSLILTTLNQAHAKTQRTVAITETVNHPSLIQAKRGILTELKNNGYEEENLRIIY
jgi:ABC-type uncharacterized transport system substrate-binding protein